MDDAAQQPTQPQQPVQSPSAQDNAGVVLPAQDQAVQPTSTQPVQSQPAQPVSPLPVAPVPVQQPAIPAAGMAKEQELGSTTVHIAPEAPVAAEFVKPSEQAPELPQEVQEAGVEVVHETPQLTLQDKHAGLSHAPAIAPVTTTPKLNVELPPQAEIIQVLKTTPDKDSKKWMFMLFEKVGRKFGLFAK